MAVPSSGELELRGDIALEVYGSATGSNISLGTMSDLAGFSSPDAMTDFYGYSSSVAPSVTTNAISNVAETSVTLNGNVTSDGGATITERGFYFGTNSSSPTNNTKYTVSGTTGAYTNNRTGLSGSTTYYSWAFATNSQGTTYGSRVQATTVAAFVPTFAAISYGNVQIQNFSDGCVPFNVTNNPQKLYQNPNTGGYVVISYSSDAITGCSTKNYLMTTSGGQGLCTNAVNVVGGSTFIDSPYTPQNKRMNYNVTLQATGGRTFSNVSNIFVTLIDTINVWSNTSTYIGREYTGTNTAQTSNIPAASVRLNYS